VLGDVAGQYSRRDYAACGDRPPSPTLCHRSGLRRGRSRHDQRCDDRWPEERKLQYILGVRERNTKEVYDVVLNDTKPFVPLLIPRERRDTELEAKNVWVGKRRYVVCRNLSKAKRDAEVREGVLRTLRESLRRGDEALVGNSAYRRYLKTPDEKHFEIDEKRVADDARYDGLYVLRTNMRLDAIAVMLRYRELLKVEDIFRTTKSILDTRPIYHQTDAAIRGHVFCSCWRSCYARL
jgi:hypothetical protein